jgi:uncharacterized membrane protein YfhO
LLSPTEQDSLEPKERWPIRPVWVDLGITAVVATVLMAVVLRYLPLYGKSMVWMTDGMAQHYPALYLLNDWLRGIAYNPGGGVPLWSWHLGMGADIISTLSFYVVGDPFTLVSLAFPMHDMEWAFVLMYALRIVAATLASMLYLRRMGAKALASAVGAVIFVFATYLTFTGLHHPMFFNAMVFLPLLLIGVENVLQRRRAWTFAAFVFLAAAGNFYFFYMLTLVTVLYAAARYFQTSEKATRWRGLPSQFLRFAGYYIVGVALAAPILLPTILAILNSARGQAEYEITLFYPLSIYRSMLPALASASLGETSVWLGYAYLGLVLVPAAFVARKTHGALKLMVVACALFVALPMFGSIFNGFTFPSNRWSFAWGIFIAALAALLLSEDRPFTRKEILAMCAGFAGYVTLVLVLCQPLSVTVVAPMVFGALTIGIFAIEGLSDGVGAWGQRGRGPGWLPGRWQAPATRWAIIALLVANVLTNAMFLLDIRYSGALTEYVDAGEVRGLYTTNQSKLIRSLPKSEAYRVDNTHTTKRASTWWYYNTALVNKYMGTSFYYSIMDGHLTDYHDEIDNSTGWSSFSFDGFDDRAMPTTLAGTKYYITEKDETEFVPYGFERDSTRGQAVAYRNTNALPLGFVYTEVIDRSEYEPLDPVDKPGAMLQGAVVDDDALAGLPRVKPVRDAVDLSYTVESTSSGATFDNRTNEFVRTQWESRLDLAVRPVPDSEVYVELRGIEDAIQSPGERPAMEIGDDPSKLDEIVLRNRDRSYLPPATIGTRFSTEQAAKSNTLWTKESPYYSNDSQLVNLGYHPDGTSRVTIERSLIGTMTLDSLKVWALPMAEHPKRVAKLNANPMTDIELGNNRVSGKVDSARNGVLFLSVPYSTGWTATVDGKPADTIRVNTTYTGVPVDAGKHSVVLTYVTPGLVPGIIAAIVALIGFAVVRLVRRASRRSGSRGTGSYSPQTRSSHSP